MTLKVNEDIQLRSWKPEWAAELFRLTNKNRKYLQPWLPWVPSVKTAADSKKFIVNSSEEQGKGTSLELSIWYQGKLVGCLGLHGLNKAHRRASIGYWLDFEHQGKGIMTTSVKALIDYSFHKLNLNRVGLEAATENSKSQAIAKRLNFCQEGVAREFEFVDNRFLSVIVFSLLKHEWKT